MRPGELVVHCSVRDGAGVLVEHVSLRLPADAPAFVVLAGVLRLTLQERRRGRTITVDGPAEVAALLELCGICGNAGDVTL